MLKFLKPYPVGQAVPVYWAYLLSFGLFVFVVGELFNTSGGRHAFQTYMLLFLPSLILLLKERLCREFWARPESILFLAFLGVAFLQGVFNPGAEESVGHWLKIMLLIALYIYAIGKVMQNEKAFHTFLYACVFGAALFAIWTIIYQYVVLGKELDYLTIRRNRLYEVGYKGFGDLGNPVISGLFYSVPAIVGMYLFIGCKKKLWLDGLLVLAIGAIFVYIVLTLSRSAWFAVAAGSLVILFLNPNRKSLIAGVVLFGFSIAVVLLFSEELRHLKERGLSGRELIWRDWLNNLNDFWLLGAGLGQDYLYKFDKRMVTYHAHSLYLQVWYEMGVIGFGLFLAMLLSLLKKGWEHRKHKLAKLGLGLLAFSMMAMVADVGALFDKRDYWWVVTWLPFGILLGLHVSERKSVGRQGA